MTISEQIEFIEEYLYIDMGDISQMEKWEAILESLQRLKNLEKITEKTDEAYMRIVDKLEDIKDILKN